MVMKLFKLGFAVLGATLALHSYALAQTATGSISGVVEDESGAVIPGVNVTVTNVDTGISRSLLTDASGRYHAPTLIPDHYEVQAQREGFETGIRKGIQVTVGSNLEINMALKVGQVAQTTVVTAEAPIVETATSTMVGLVDDRTIRELPLNGRSFDQLIALQSSTPTARARTRQIVNGTADLYSVNGARVQANMFLIDGTEMLGAGSITTLPGGALGKNMGVDAVQEFTVLSANYSSAYGKKGGGIVNIATRAGTNQIHGSAFEFLRNSALDARNFFDSTPQPPPFRRNNFGGALGGPIRKDHSFFFGNYEGLREGVGLTQIALVPDANAQQGLLPDPKNPGQFTNVVVAPEVKPYLAAFFPLPNGRNFGDGTGEFLTNPQQINTQDFFLARFDQRISDKDSLFVRYNLTRSSQLTPETTTFFNDLTATREQALTLEEKRAYARTVNVLRFGFTRAYLSSTIISTAPMDPALRFLPWADIVGTMRFSGAGGAGASGALTVAGPVGFNRWYVVNQFDVADQLYHYRGPHSLQFGVQVQRIHNNQNVISEPGGTFQFTDLVSLLAGKPLRFSGLVAGNYDPTKAYRQLYFSSFIQDDYKVLRNLTLNLGLRYELFSVPVEASGNRISNYRLQFVDGFMIPESLPTLGSPFFQGNHNTFAPRIGFAWDPFSDGKLSVRGGFGIFYDEIDSDFRFQVNSNPPFVRVLEVSSPSFPHAFSGAAGSPPLPTANGMDFNLRVPTRLQYSFGVQRQLTSSRVFNIAYVGSHSFHLTRKTDPNTARPQFLPGGTVFYPAGSPRLNPALGTGSIVITDADAFYNSVQLEFNQRLSRGIRYKVSYTFAKSIDDASYTVSSFYGQANDIQNPYDRKADRGLSAFDMRQNLVMNFTYEVPWSNLSGVTGRLLGGWQLSGIATLSAGTPVTALTSVNRSRSLAGTIPDRPNLKAGASNNPVLGGPDRYFDPSVFELQPAGFYGNLVRNTLIGPGFANVDFTLGKMTSVNERLKLDFRADFFNLLNRANFDLPNNKLFTSSGSRLGAAGSIRSTISTSRQIQFGLKLTF